MKDAAERLEEIQRGQALVARVADQIELATVELAKSGMPPEEIRRRSLEQIRMRMSPDDWRAYRNCVAVSKRRLNNASEAEQLRRQLESHGFDADLIADELGVAAEPARTEDARYDRDEHRRAVRKLVRRGFDAGLIADELGTDSYLE